jgi:hypothetical protein
MNGFIDPHFLDLSISWRWVVNFMPRTTLPPGKESPVPIRLEVGWTPEPVWTTWRKSLTLPDLRPFGRPARSQSLYQERYPVLSVKVIRHVINTPGIESKVIPVTGRGGPQDGETSRLPHFTDNRLRDGGEAVSLRRRPPFTSSKIRGIHFC